MIEASRIPLPEADSQLKLKTAPSAVGLATTGGIRTTSLSRPGAANLSNENPSRKLFVCGKPQTKTTTLRMIQGTHARRISDCEFRVAESDVELAGSSPGNRQMRFGRQIFRKTATAAIE